MSAAMKLWGREAFGWSGRYENTPLASGPLGALPQNIYEKLLVEIAVFSYF